jgi:alkanesulfonate monooxygenase SsuD/methylene tetrahydromethanopterin reductase-like flavin-dependent oxidoreductase (luciferase family)
LLSRGRIVVAVAAGWLEQEFTTLGAAFEGRGQRLDDWLELARSAFAQIPGPVEHEGALPIGGAWLAPSLLRPGGIELWIAGVSEATLRRASRTGVWHPVALPPERLAELSIWFRELRPDGRIVLRLSTLFADEPDPGSCDERGRHAVAGPPRWIAERLCEYVAGGCDGFLVACRRHPGRKMPRWITVASSSSLKPAGAPARSGRRLRTDARACRSAQARSSRRGNPLPANRPAAAWPPEQRR